jgi:hypothetical protein
MLAGRSVRRRLSHTGAAAALPQPAAGAAWLRQDRCGQRESATPSRGAPTFCGAGRNGRCGDERRSCGSHAAFMRRSCGAPPALMRRSSGARRRSSGAQRRSYGAHPLWSGRPGCGGAALSGAPSGQERRSCGAPGIALSDAPSFVRGVTEAQTQQAASRTSSCAACSRAAPQQKQRDALVLCACPVLEQGAGAATVHEAGRCSSGRARSRAVRPAHADAYGKQTGARMLAGCSSSGAEAAGNDGERHGVLAGCSGANSSGALVQSWVLLHRAGAAAEQKRAARSAYRCCPGTPAGRVVRDGEGGHGASEAMTVPERRGPGQLFP